MTAEEIFNLGIQTGVLNDPRGRTEIKRILKESRREYKELPEKKQKEYDQEKFTNPYSDSRFLTGDKKAQVKTVLVGVDIGTEEVLLAKELERQGKKINLIIAHHPEGQALADLHEVMEIQTAVLAQAGVPENIGEGVLRERLEQVWRSVASANHYKSVMAAQLLNIPMINIHTPADNCVWNFVSKYIKKKEPKTVGEVVDTLKEIPEYKVGTKQHAGPSIFAGNEKGRAGKIVVSGMTGGTSGSEKIYERMSHFGIGTEIAMHIREEDRKEAIKHYINVVIAGHISSDSLGLNIIMDKIEAAGIKIIPCSGYIRYSRNNQIVKN